MDYFVDVLGTCLDLEHGRVRKLSDFLKTNLNLCSEGEQMS